MTYWYCVISLLVICDVATAGSDEDSAAKKLEAADCIIYRDSKLPGNPVVEVSIAAAYQDAIIKEDDMGEVFGGF